MKYHLHENGWTVILEDFNMASCTQDEIYLIERLIAKYTLVIVKNQHVSKDEEIRFIKMFHNSIPIMSPGIPGFDSIAVDPEGLILRVTGEKDNSGNVTGIAGHDEELTWHSNPPYDPDRNSIIYLRAVTGSAGSITEWNNTILAYQDLPQETKDQLLPLKIIPMIGTEKDMRLGHAGTTGEEHPEQARFNLVYTNIAGQTGLYFPYYQIARFDGMTVEESKKIMDPLFKHVTQSKYCYQHHWDDGDATMAEQWLGIHRRLHFDRMQNRLLHRAGLDFSPQNFVGTLE
jgi:alpha-ketoglutarate-dependent taurine dioxygenase